MKHVLLLNGYYWNVFKGCERCQRVRNTMDVFTGNQGRAFRAERHTHKQFVLMHNKFNIRRVQSELCLIL